MQEDNIFPYNFFHKIIDNRLIDGLLIKNKPERPFNKANVQAYFLLFNLAKYVNFFTHCAF